MIVKRAAKSAYLRFAGYREAMQAAWNAIGTLFMRNQQKRWARVSQAGAPPWDARNQIIARAISPGSSVVDLGCGPQTLRTRIPANCRYQPCDLVRATEDTILCDFNGGIYPEFQEKFDFAICSGVLEYIREPEAFLRKISGYGNILILSYNARKPAESIFSRRAKHWVNDFTQAEMESLFRRSGLDFQTVYQADGIGLIYHLRQRPAQ